MPDILQKFDFARQYLNLPGDYFSQGARDNLAAGYNNTSSILEAVEAGKLDPYQAQIMLSRGGALFPLNEEQEKAFNNLLARYQSQNALLWQADQLQQLGLSNSGVLQTGAAHTAQDMSNVATSKADRKARVLSGVANSFINMAGRMGSAGIHGAALEAVKGAASMSASTLAHSASNALKKSTSSNSNSDAERAAYWADTHMSKEDKNLLAFFDGR